VFPESAALKTIVRPSGANWARKIDICWNVIG
jgi:hypothetical protein